ncbi:MAG: cytochrome C, partial [Planctomycetes bacterium]|nr:cytochrome C [Planctomycetota bacterium]
EILSDGTGPWDISAADATLDLVVDGGKDVFIMGAGSDAEVLPATISVAVADGTFANTAAATAAEIVDWLNADIGEVYEGEWDAAFSTRAIAYLDGGMVAIRSRNLGDFFSLQLLDSEVNIAVFGGTVGEDSDVQVVGGSTPSNRVYQYTVPADNDPKAAWTTGAITYPLDPVDDLAPGTYVASVEMADRGRVSMTDYQTPSVGWVTFQVGTATEQPLVADSCDKCHEGFVLDYPRHHKPFPNDAVDGCAACHDYQNRNATGEWSGGQPISRRTHAVHFGSSLNYPLTTVAHEETVAGRNWDITFPQDIRHCESCHSADSSGTWAINAARIPCSGCHDSDEATAHMDIMTWDPTPADPWSGDEEESCKACH